MPLPCAPRQEAPESVSEWCFPRSSRTWVQSLHERSLASIMLFPAGLALGGSPKCQSCKQGSRVQSWLVQEWRSAGRSLPSDERPALTGGSAPVHHHHAGCGKADVHEGESPARTGRSPHSPEAVVHAPDRPKPIGGVQRSPSGRRRAWSESDLSNAVNVLAIHSLQCLGISTVGLGLLCRGLDHWPRE